MNILIFTDTSKLTGTVKDELCHLDGSIYIQYIDPCVNKPEDIKLVHWNILIVDEGVRMTPEWNRAFHRHTNNFLLSKFFYDDMIEIFP